MIGNFDLPQVPKPTQPTGGPRPPSPEMPGTKLILEPEFHSVYGMWQRDKTPETNDAILKAVKPIIDSAVKTYGGSAVNPTLKSRAKKIVIDSMPKYDPYNTKLKTYLFNQMQGLKRFSMQQNQIINIPEQVQLDYVSLKKKEELLREELGRDPSDTELSDSLSMSPKRLAYVRGLRMPSSEGTVLQPFRNSDSGDFNEPSVASKTNRSEMGAWHSFVYDSLGNIDKVIMEHSLGLNGKTVLSSQGIASKLGITQAAISMRKSKIQKELDKRETLQVI